MYSIEPDEAITAYREAYNLGPNDAYVAAKLGRAYVKTHQYAKAIKYYTEASRHTNTTALRLDLAELYLKLRRFADAERTLLDALAEEQAETEASAADADASADVVRLQQRTKKLLLLARIRERAGNGAGALETLALARDNQHRVEQRTSLMAAAEEGGFAGVQEQKKMMAKCVDE